MRALHAVDVSKDLQFQTLYKGFYRVRQKSQAWYCAYFDLMEQSKGNRPRFSYVLNELRTRIGNDAYEPSFSSKFVASTDPWSPVWDEYVLRNTGHTSPSYASRSKHDDAVTAYSSIVGWYDQFLRSPQGRRWVMLFNDNVAEYYKITDVK